VFSEDLAAVGHTSDSLAHHGSPTTQGDGSILRFWIVGRALPAAPLLALVIWQIWALVGDGATLVDHPTLAVVMGCLRSSLYAVFLSIPTVVLLLHDPPNATDSRILIRFLAIVASFFFILLGVFAPSGPLLLRVPLIVEVAAFTVSLIGVILAVCAMATLGMNFSYWPEARRLVVRGPYLLVRHPVYLAEIMLSSGALIPNLRLTMVVGECVAVVLLMVRIHAEERLLELTFPAFKAFEATTPYRLVPGVW
jgi:protein-S-isoprenylcysteine O-methyltransferase Ste14